MSGGLRALSRCSARAVVSGAGLIAESHIRVSPCTWEVPAKRLFTKRLMFRPRCQSHAGPLPSTLSMGDRVMERLLLPSYSGMTNGSSAFQLDRGTHAPLLLRGKTA